MSFLPCYRLELTLETIAKFRNTSTDPPTIFTDFSLLLPPKVPIENNPNH
jgi:hypothetical protein